MKKLNNKGFTLIELLAVIVLLAIIVTVTTPIITRQLSNARASSFATKVNEWMVAIRDNALYNGLNGESSVSYNFSDMNKVIVGGVAEKSPYDGGTFNDNSIEIVYSNNSGLFNVCVTDGKHYIYKVDSASVSVDDIDSNNVPYYSSSCTDTDPDPHCTGHLKKSGDNYSCENVSFTAPVVP